MIIHNPINPKDSALEQIPIVIPSLNPDEKLLGLLKALRSEPERLLTIIVVNDGSRESCGEIFRKAEEQYSCRVLTHAVRQGKGRALKTAFRYVLDQLPDCIGAVTMDGDGQHSVEDVFACMKKLAAHPHSLILGCRSFDGEDIPLKSRFGNKLTRRVLQMTKGMSVEDTQTGLRAIPRFFLEALTEVPGEGYEFEMNMLLECGERGIPIVQVPIRTIYLDGNQSSHFRPVSDSLKIYTVFLRYLLSALSSFLLDIAAFSLFVLLLKAAFPVRYIFLSTVLARVFSSAFNYFANRNLVFQADQGAATAVRYYLLALLQMAASGLLVMCLYTAFPHSGETLLKIPVDTALFFLSFYIQRKWVFRLKPIT